MPGIFTGHRTKHSGSDYPLFDGIFAAITKLQHGHVEKRIVENHKVPFRFNDEVVKLITDRCTELESSGRMIDAILTNAVLPEISQEFLTRVMEGKPVERVHVGERVW